jgi:hypothetical protein
MTPLTRRATAEYRRAAPTHIERGRAWYRDANAIALNHVVEYGVSIEQASGILAALSPRMGWGSNVMFAERMLASKGTLDQGCLGRSLAQARRIYAGEDPLAVMKGPKTRAFYDAILTGGEGDGPAVIDVHAWSMLTGSRDVPPPTNKQYREAAVLMARGAKIVGESVHDFQAITWLTWRQRWWRPGVNDYNGQTMLEGADQWA